LKDQGTLQQFDLMKDGAADRYTLADIRSIGRKRKADRVRAIFAHFLPSLPDSARVLEIGPGRGEFARACLSRELSYLGVEPSEELCKIPEKTSIPIISQTVPPIKLESDTFDLIHSNDFVEHLTNYVDVMRFFGEAFRVLKPGDYFSIIRQTTLVLNTYFFPTNFTTLILLRVIAS
jgi:SAM-dependent methyltransferase